MTHSASARAMGTMALRSALARPDEAPWLKAASPALLEMLRDTPALIAPTAFFKGESGAITPSEAFDGQVLYNVTSHAVEILIGDSITVTEPPEGSDQQDTLVYSESRLASFTGQFVYFGKQARQVEALGANGETRSPGWSLYLDVTVFGMAYDEEFQADTLAELLSLLIHNYPRLWSVLASDPRILVMASLLGFSEHVAPTHFDLPTTAEDMLNAVFDYGASLHSGSGDPVADEGVFDEEDGEDFSLLMQQAGTATNADDLVEEGDPAGLLPFDPDAARVAQAELHTLATAPTSAFVPHDVQISAPPSTHDILAAHGVPVPLRSQQGGISPEGYSTDIVTHGGGHPQGLGKPVFGVQLDPDAVSRHAASFAEPALDAAEHHETDETLTDGLARCAELLHHGRTMMGRQVAPSFTEATQTNAPGNGAGPAQAAPGFAPGFAASERLCDRDRPSVSASGVDPALVAAVWDGATATESTAPYDGTVATQTTAEG